MYKYENEKAALFTDAGQRKFLKVRDNVSVKLRLSGAVSMAHAIEEIAGVNWEAMACVDRLIELGEIKEIPQGGVAGQARIFVKA